MKMFDGCDGLKDVTERVSPQSTFSEFQGKVTFTLRSIKEDDTIPRLKKEVGRDHYAIGTSLNPALIIDVGANIGDFCISVAKLYPKAQVICAEPAPETYFLLRWNLAENNVPLIGLSSLGRADRPGVVPLHGALGSSDGFVDFVYSPKKSQNANIGGGPGINGDASWRHVKVQAYDLGNMLSTAKVKSVDVLKVDCEGCEFSLLPSLHDWVVDRDRIKRLVGEIHWWQTSKKKKTLGALMDPTDVQKFKDTVEKRGSPVHFGINAFPG
jgi:FkbM family methyltransferase